MLRLDKRGDDGQVVPDRRKWRRDDGALALDLLPGSAGSSNVVGCGMNPSYRSVCWAAHFAIAMSICLWFEFFKMSPWYGMLCVALWTLPKDLIWDRYVEDSTLKWELVDVFTYLGGAFVTGTLVLSLRGY